MIIESVIAEVLPIDKFGDYLRSHLTTRMDHYSWEIVRLSVQHFNPYVPEAEIRQWFDSNRENQKNKWKTEILPAIKQELQTNALSYVSVKEEEE